MKVKNLDHLAEVQWQNLPCCFLKNIAFRFSQFGPMQKTDILFKGLLTLKMKVNDIKISLKSDGSLSTFKYVPNHMSGFSSLEKTVKFQMFNLEI